MQISRAVIPNWGRFVCSWDIWHLEMFLVVTTWSGGGRVLLASRD